MLFDELLRQRNVSVFTEGRYCRTGWVQFHCPFCSGGTDPNKPYAGWNIANNYVNCWRCGAHNAQKTIQLLCNVPWKQAGSLLEQVLGTPVAEHSNEHVGTLQIPKEVGPLLRCHKNYIRQRDFDPDELKALWGIKGIGLASKLAWRLWIPITLRGRVVSWTTRALVDDGVRYISASAEQESVPHKTLLYGEDYAGTSITVHEGAFDAWRIGPGAVATLGTATTPAQVRRIAHYPRRIICFDAEPSAQRRAQRLCQQLAPFPGETINVVLDAKDMAVASTREIRQVKRLLKG